MGKGEGILSMTRSDDQYTTNQVSEANDTSEILEACSHSDLERRADVET